MLRSLPVGLVILCFVGAAQADTVSLRFKWPDGLKLNVSRRFDRTESRFGKVKKTSSESNYLWSGNVIGRNYEIRISDFRMTIPEPKPQSKDGLVQLEHLSRSIDPLLPTIIVDANAQPVNIEGLAEIARRHREAYGSIPEIRNDPMALRAAEGLASEQLLTQRVLEDWNGMVQVWHGNVAEIGTITTTEADLSVPGGGPVRFALEYAIKECGARDGKKTSRQCVSLTVTQTPKTSDWQTAAKALLGFDFVSLGGTFVC